MSKTDIEKIKDFGKKLESSGADYSEVTLRDMLNQSGLNSDLVERTIKDYRRYRDTKTSYLSILTGDQIREIGAEALTDTMIKLSIDRGFEIVGKILTDYLRYIKYKKAHLTNT